ncbi:MAG: flippase-like domain-containing protein [Deltaproteobacteria bacterium]|nr:flippase-like domain-containing protein [Deltaproteobacteria bacterium]
MKAKRPWLTFALAVVGVGLLALVVRTAGPRAIMDLLVHARGAFLLGFVLEGARIACEGVGGAMLFAPEERNRGVVSRSIEVELRTYALCQLAPMGRTAAEALKIPFLAAHGTVGDRVAVAVRSQALGLWSIFVISVPCVVASMLEPAGGLATTARTAAIGGHALVVLVLSMLLLGTRAHERMTKLVSQRWASRAGEDHEARPATSDRRRLVDAAPWFVAARGIQLLQIAVFSASVGAGLHLRSLLVALGVHYAGAGAGEVVPGHMGASEAAMNAAASSLGMTVEAAVAIALLTRGVQIAWSIVSVLTPVVRRRAAQPA